VTPNQVTSGFTQESFEAFLADRREPEWLVALRRQAWETFQQLPLPDRKLEEWMRTDIRAFRLEHFAPPDGASAAENGTDDAPGLGTSVPSMSVTPLLTHGVDLSGSVISADSRAGVASLDEELASRGVLFGSLDRLVCSHEDVLRPYLFAAVDYHADKFAALHAACWSGGLVLYVPKGVVIERPLHMLSVLSPGAVDLSHALIILEEGAEATVLAETASLDPAAAGLHCGAIEIHVGPRAKLRYVNLQDWGTGVWHFAHQRALVDRDATPAMDHRRAGKPAGQGESARGHGRAGSERRGQRSHVHRGPAAPLLPHAATSPGTALHQRFCSIREHSRTSRGWCGGE